MQTFYLIFKTLHIFGFIIVIGITFANILAYGQFWKIYQQDRAKGIAAFALIQRFFKVGMVSIIVLLFAGIGMLAIANWSFAQLFWFQIKLGLTLLIFLNGFTLGRTSALKVQALIDRKNETYDRAEVSSLKSRTRIFFILQLLIFLIIVIVSVFRFS